MIITDAYSTTYGQIELDESDLGKLQSILYIQDYNQKKITFSTGLNIYYITPFTKKEVTDIPLLKFPAIISGPGHEQKTIMVDIRPFINTQRTLKEDTIIATNQTEMTLAIIRGVLNAYFIDDISHVKSSLKYANTVYAGLISDTIGKRFGLNPEEQLKVFIVAYAYYTTLFTNEKELTENHKLLIIKDATLASRAGAHFVKPIVEALTPMGYVTDLVTNIKNAVGGVRLEELNSGLLITILASTWYGTFAKEILAVSLEHVPTFTAIVGVSSTQRFWKKSLIYSICERYGKGGKLEEYLRSLSRMTMDAENE